VIAAVGIGIIVLGVGAGALLSGGGGGGGNDDTGKTVAATAPAKQGSSAAAGDPVKAQAVELDKLLANSTSSRDSVINAVADVKVCNNLDQAAGDLRDAAKQRGELVTRLSSLAVDKLPNHDELAAALTSAWKASAAADNHYAAWADQANNDKKGCHKGHARTTGQTLAGNQASGTASAQKEKAARLWNSIASKYGLTQRTRTQL
jgi:predicted nucleic acid-binding protein